MNLLKEFYAFLVARKLWWIAPIIIILLGFGVLIWLAESSAAVAPFIYTVF